MASKILNTVLKLRYDTYANWVANKSVVPQAGEACVCTVPQDTGTGMNEPAVLIKIGDGTTTWENLPWVSALAANVASNLLGSNPTLPAESITGLSDYISGQIEDTDTQYQLVKVGANSFKLQYKALGEADWTDGATIDLSSDVSAAITTALDALDMATVTAGQGEIIESISENNGVVSATKRSLVAADIPSLTADKISDLDTAIAEAVNPTDPETESPIKTAVEEIAGEVVNGVVGDMGESATVVEYVGSSIETALGTLQDNGQTAGTGEVISAVSQADGVISVQKKTLAEADIPAISISKVTDLQTSLDGKQATVVWNTAYDAGTNKAATMADVTAAVAGLSGAMHYVGESTSNPAEGTATVEGHETWVAGDVVTYQAKEYVYDGENWRELGDESSYAIKGAIKNADIAADAAIDQSKIAGLIDALNAKATPADITTAIQNLDKAAVDVAVGSKISQIEEVDGIINIVTSAITANDIPELPQSKITDLVTTLAGKQDNVTFDGTYNAESNKAATVSTVTGAIASLNVQDTAVDGQVVSAVSETGGKITVSRRALVANDIPALTADKITNLTETVQTVVTEAITDEEGTGNAVLEAVEGAVTDGINEAIQAGGAITNAVNTQITTALGALDNNDQAVEHNFLTAAVQTDGAVVVSRAQPSASDISGLSYFATGTDAINLTLASGNYLILNGGGASGF